MKMTRRLICVGFLAAVPGAPLAAQTRPSDATSSIALRPFFVVTGQRFAANETFDAVFGRAVQPFWGGGLELAFRNGLYVDVAASRFQKTGQRVFFFDGRALLLGIKLTATETPFELTGGYRFRLRRAERVTPYAGAGVGWYAYTETSDFADASDNVDTSHVGYLLVGGVEFRASRWIRLSGDVQYTHVPGILGTGGVSENVGERDLGGVAARLKVIVGR